MARPPDVSACVQILTEMIEEAQEQINHALSEIDKQILRAKRDALDEVKFRIRDGIPDPTWTKHIPLRK